MSKFHFSFCVKPSDETFFYQHVELETVEDGVQISCEAPDSECVHLLAPEKYMEFCKAIGQDSIADPIDAAKAAVKKNKRPIVFDAVHEIAEVKFTWYDWDSPFYGDKGIEVSNEPQFDPPKRLFYGMLADYSTLSEADKERFVSDLAKQFFPGVEGVEKDIAEIAESGKIIDIPWDPFAER